MEIERLERIKKTTAIHLAMETKETLKKITEDFPDNPDAMGYFYDVFNRFYTEGVRGGDTVSPTVGTMCLQVPDELIYAAGAVPVRLCSGAYAYDQIGAEFMPAKSCSLVNATLGMLHINHVPYKDLLKAVIIPTTCDQRKKAADMLEGMGLRTYPLEMPSVKDTEEGRFYWQHSVSQFAKALEQITGNRITRKSLSDSIMKTNRARAEFRRFHNIRKAMPSVIYGKDAFLVANAYFFDGIEQWTDALTKLNNELEGRSSKGISVANRHAPRILFTGSPVIFPNLKLPLLIEQTGGIVAADEVCSSSRLLYDAVTFDEANLYDMIPAIADRYLKPCTCPCFVKNEDRKRKLLDMVKGFNVDGVVYQAFSGCSLYAMEYKSISAMLETEGIPMLYIETDYSPEDTGQLSTRIEAFMESIKARKRRL
jgi:benzoyl-CoA reductase/2-hydroxyglutaryl-CoA dehydratase subunit BcrC/BadD/HgdB